MTPRDWQKDEALLQLCKSTAADENEKHVLSIGLHWLQEAKERGEREQRLKKTLEQIAEATEDVFTEDAARHTLRTLYPDTPAPTNSDQTFQNLFREERNKGSQLPDADADFEALDNALKRYGEIEVEEGDNQ